MSDLSDLLTQTVAPRVRAELKPHLHAFYGMLVRSYLPQVWWFTSESSQVALEVDKHGDCRVSDGQGGKPDVSITWTDLAFRIALSTGSQNELPPGVGPPKVKIHSHRGKAGYDQLRKRLGL